MLHSKMIQTDRRKEDTTLIVSSGTVMEIALVCHDWVTMMNFISFLHLITIYKYFYEEHSFNFSDNLNVLLDFLKKLWNML